MKILVASQINERRLDGKELIRADIQHFRHDLGVNPAPGPGANLEHHVLQGAAPGNIGSSQRGIRIAVPVAILVFGLEDRELGADTLAAAMPIRTDAAATAAAAPAGTTATTTALQPSFLKIPDAHQTLDFGSGNFRAHIVSDL